MNKKIYWIILTGLLLTVLTTACNLAISQSADATTVPTVSATETPAATATLPAPTASPTPAFAPFCTADTVSVLPPSQCQAPVAEESSTFCSEKDPYNLILLDPGLTYEVLTKGFKCADAGKKDDRQMITCTGLMSSTFELNVCDPTCVIPTVEAAITQCPQDYFYNDVQGCCTQEAQQVNQTCTVQKFNTTSCTANCDNIRRKSNCLKNSFACVWNYEEKSCQLRK